MLAGTNDDIGALQTAPAHLKADEDLIRTLTGNDMTQRWFVVTGASTEEALQRKDALGERLSALKEDGLITGATLIPLNSRATQQSDWELIKKASPAVLAKLRESGISAKPESENPTLPFGLDPGHREQQLGAAGSRRRGRCRGNLPHGPRAGGPERQSGRRASESGGFCPWHGLGGSPRGPESPVLRRQNHD